MLSEHGILVKFTPNWMLEQEFRTQHERASIGHRIVSITTFWDVQNNHSGDFFIYFFILVIPLGFDYLEQSHLLVWWAISTGMISRSWCDS